LKTWRSPQSSRAVFGARWMRPGATPERAFLWI
jgi:hypothetical protein